MNSSQFSDTIAAVSTATGNAALAVVRISGQKSIAIISELTQKDFQKIESRQVTFCRIFDKQQLLDEVLVTVFRSPASYTGEDMVEISCHGSLYITQRIMELLLLHCRMAEPGEFTQRAFLNNKMDLTQAESVGDLLNAETRKAHAAAIEQLEGQLYKRINNHLKQLTTMRSKIELAIDFVEDDVHFADTTELLEELVKIHAELEQLAGSGNSGQILREGLRVCLTGAANVGKSSIFNAFLETERAIVTPHPGTTRDYLEEAVSLDGYLIRLYDTAGLRVTGDAAELAGIDKTHALLKKAHVVLHVTDGQADGCKPLLPKEVTIINVLNKSDLHTQDEITDWKAKGFIPTNTIESGGLTSLKSRLLGLVKISEEKLHSGILTNARQIAAVQKAVAALAHAKISLNEKLGFEFTAFDLSEASRALEEVIGKVTAEDILNQIFAHYCIGK
ncbi:MAG: tRNA uridine-5-carboxymethylaminomethyl(34) synthesis GTPase MnmE [Candidatus Cloacimonetes bacterium]|nr:tRNA uridine-5-carboxymethylaminomethyl(34) synthesis GTPase MnmE [Candidatus Cloacimonadota bacterium]